jgi:hypothetical protein
MLTRLLGGNSNSDEEGVSNGLSIRGNSYE